MTDRAGDRYTDISTPKPKLALITEEMCSLLSETCNQGAGSSYHDTRPLEILETEAVIVPSHPHVHILIGSSNCVDNYLNLTDTSQ
jgi:hypothetical protein